MACVQKRLLILKCPGASTNNNKYTKACCPLTMAAFLLGMPLTRKPLARHKPHLGTFVPAQTNAPAHTLSECARHPRLEPRLTPRVAYTVQPIEYALTPRPTVRKVAADKTMVTMKMGAIVAMPAYGGRQQRARAAQQPLWLPSRAVAAPGHMSAHMQNEKHEAKK